MRQWLRVAAAAFSIVPIACDNGRYAEQQEFFRQNVELQHQAFRAMQPAQQIKVYLAGRARHPPDPSFCSDIAETTGAAAIPAIIAALRTEKEEYEKAQLLLALGCAADSRPEACDQTLMSEARTAASSIGTTFWRQEAERAVRGIRCPPSK